MSPNPTKKPKTSPNEDYCINVIRMLSADQPSAAKSGHPGAPIGCAPMAHVLFKKLMHYNPSNPKWYNRDRFVLSNGHASALLYSMLYLTGYAITLNDLKEFRQYGSKCPGHPENHVTPGVELTTGPLGQGISNAVGLAIAEKQLSTQFNRDEFKVIDHYTYVICGDGCLQEGISSEASSLAGHLGLGKLIVLYDDNRITIDGSTNLSFTEDVLKRYEAYGWHTQVVEDGRYDAQAIEQAIVKAKQVTDKPSIIKIHTVIGLQSSIEGTEKVHGTPLTEEDLAATKKKYGLPETKFYVPEDVAKYYNHQEIGKRLEKEYNAMLAKYQEAYPDLAEEFLRRAEGKLPSHWKDSLPKFKPEDKPMATRKFSELVLNAVAANLPEIIGGSADLTPSTLTKLTMSGDFQKETPNGRYLRFGVREHGMAAISNGIFAYGFFRPFCATFLNFIGYALGAVRLSALSDFGVIYIGTHDSIYLGEDGPTHQPIEMLTSLRAMPNLHVYRPADGNEVVGTYICAIEADKKTPSVFALSRQNLPNLHGSSASKVEKGAYILQSIEKGKLVSDHTNPEIILLASGSEVSLACNAAKEYQGKKVRIVSMPCVERFNEQSIEYKREILGSNIPVMSLEAGSTLGWYKYAHLQFGIDSFGQSANTDQLDKGFFMTPKDVVAAMHDLLTFYSKGKKPHDLVEVPIARQRFFPKRDYYY